MQAQDIRTPLQVRLCNSRADAAAYIMSLHQNGIIKGTVVAFNATEKDRVFLDEVTDEAFAAPKHQSEPDQHKAVERFRVKILDECAKADLNSGDRAWQRWPQ